MKLTIRKSIVQIIGVIWMPPVTCATQKTLRDYDIENMRNDEGQITRESVEQWLTTNSGDFQSVTDFSASIEDGENTVDIPWASEESEFTYVDCMYPAEVD